tara:strand:- start:10202 stop:11161 length:960 start_codon:yes stop_codon:yes gene_type:complete
MTDQVEQDVALDDDEEVINEMQDPKNAEADSVASVKKAETAGKTASARKGDKKNSEKADAAPKAVMASYKAEEVDFEDDLEALISEEATLSEGFKGKAAIIFEAAFKSKLTEEIDRLEDEYAVKLSEETNTFKDELVEKVDGYLNYVVEQWMEENRVAVETGLRTEISEEFMENLKNLFTESYITVPESKVDLVDELSESVSELEAKLDAATAEAIAMNEALEGHERNAIIAEHAEGLAATEAEKLFKLAEDVEFGNAETFSGKVATIKESYFKKGSANKATAAAEALEEGIVEDNSQSIVEVTDTMASYLSAMRKTTY